MAQINVISPDLKLAFQSIIILIHGERSQMKDRDSVVQYGQNKSTNPVNYLQCI